MNSQELFLVLTALVERRFRDTRRAGSSPDSLHVARERMAEVRQRAARPDPWLELDAWFASTRGPKSRPSRA